MVRAQDMVRATREGEYYFFIQYLNLFIIVQASVVVGPWFTSNEHLSSLSLIALNMSLYPTPAARI